MRRIVENFGDSSSSYLEKITDDTLRLVCSGHDSVEILVGQITPVTVRQVFSVSITQLYINILFFCQCIGMESDAGQHQNNIPILHDAYDYTIRSIITTV